MCWVFAFIRAKSNPLLDGRLSFNKVYLWLSFSLMDIYSHKRSLKVVFSELTDVILKIDYKIE